MKRTDITDLFPDATKEQIDKLMGINGSDINAAKGDVDGLRAQLATAQSELQQLKAGNAGNPDEIQETKNALAAVQAELAGMKRAETIRVMREKVSGEKKIPANLLTGETEETCTAQADAILTFAKSCGYPAVQDGGEAGHPATPSTRDSFANWAEQNL